MSNIYVANLDIEKNFCKRKSLIHRIYEVYDEAENSTFAGSANDQKNEWESLKFLSSDASFDDRLP